MQPRQGGQSVGVESFKRLEHCHTTFYTIHTRHHSWTHHTPTLALVASTKLRLGSSRSAPSSALPVDLVAACHLNIPPPLLQCSPRVATSHDVLLLKVRRTWWMIPTYKNTGFEFFSLEILCTYTNKHRPTKFQKMSGA